MIAFLPLALYFIGIVFIAEGLRVAGKKLFRWAKRKIEGTVWTIRFQNRIEVSFHEKRYPERLAAADCLLALATDRPEGRA